MPGAQRKGDPNAAGGTATGGVATVKVNGRAVVVNGISVTPHPCCGKKGCPPVHCSAKTTGGVATVRAGGIAINVNGNSDTCGHARTAGSSDVRVG